MSRQNYWLIFKYLSVANISLGGLILTSATLNQNIGLAEEDLLRVNLYRLLARCLSSPIDKPFLTILSNLQGDDTELGQAFRTLAKSAASINENDAAEEYQNLFIGLGRGELLPYASYYLTGFLNEKPLARLRNDMVPLGIERDPEIKEPEDHAGALMDMMAGLIDGSFGKSQPLSIQKQFFENHIAEWTPHFFKDLQAAKEAKFYRPIGLVGELFIEIEKAAFEM